MTQLVAAPILQWYAAGQRQGDRSAVTLFADISGFTAMTEALLSAAGQQRQGAEALAEVMTAVFAPLIEAVYQQGGFVSGFAGDALTAIFDSAETALAAAWQMRTSFSAEQATPFGSFSFGLKMGLGAGDVQWQIWTSPTPDSPQQAVAAFRGAAIDACVAAEKLAASGDLIVAPSALALLAGRVSAERVDDGFARISAVGDGLPAPQPLPDAQALDAAPFVPPALQTSAIRGEFRQVVTLFVQVDLGDSGEGLTATLDAVFRLLAQYEGTICRLDFGDKGCTLLLFWGAPTAHENDVARALDFALALQAASPLPLRMGVTYRMAFAGLAGSALRAEYTCYGLSVNLAARLMTQAEWREIWLDDSVAQRAQGFELAGLGRFPFKGFQHPQAVYRLVSRDAYASDLPFYEGELVGRSAEIEQVLAALKPLRRRRLAGVVVIEGEAGIGKSRLAHEALQQAAEASQGELLLCQTDEILRQPLNPFRYLLRRVFRQHPALDEAENRRRFDSTLQALVRRTPDPALAAELARTGSFLAALLDLFWPESLYAQLEPELRFENTLIALKTFFLARASLQPLILHVEDAQWLDAESQQMVARLLHNIDDVALALVLTSRTPISAEIPPDVPLFTLKLTPLSAVAVAAQATDLLDAPPAPALVDLLESRAEGNPFYVEQLVRFMQERDLLTDSAEGMVARRQAAELPADIQAVLIARLDRLTHDVREVVQTAAVLGREFEVDVLSRMLYDTAHLPSRLAQAEGAAVWSALSELRYIFRHALLQDAAYQMQLESRLATLHRLAVTAIETLYGDAPAPYLAQLVYHSHLGRDPQRERRYAQLAAEQAASRYANADAIRYFSRALALTSAEDVAPRFELLRGRVDVYHLTGEREAQRADLAALADSAEALDVDAQVAVWTAYTDYALETSDYPSMVDYAQRTIAAAQQAGDVVGEIRGLTQWGNALFRLGESEEAVAKLTEALAGCEAVRTQNSAEIDVRANEAAIHKGLNVACVRLGQYDRARDHILQSIALSEEIGNLRSLGNSYNNLALVFYHTGDYAEARDHMRHALEVAGQVGERSSECLFTGNLGVISYKMGDVDAAARYYEQALALQLEINDIYSQIMTLNNLGVLAMDQTRYEQAIDYYERSLALAQASNDRANQLLGTINLGLVALKTGDFISAERQSRAAIAICHEVGDGYHEIESLSNLIWTLCDVGNSAEAQVQRAVLQPKRAEIEDVQMVGHACAAEARAALLAGEFEAAAALYEEGLALLDSAEVPFLDVRAECLAGQIRLALAQERVPDSAVVEALLALVEAGDTRTAIRELDVVWALCEGLRARKDGRISAVVQRAYDQCQEQAAQFADAERRDLFLNQIAANRAIVAAYESLQKGD